MTGASRYVGAVSLGVRLESCRHLVSVREDARIFGKEAEEKTRQEHVEVMPLVLLVVVDGADAVVESAHLLADFGVCRMFGVHDGFLVQPRHGQEELEVRRELTERKFGAVLDLAVIGEDVLEVRDKDEADSVRFQQRKSLDFLKGIEEGRTILHGAEIQLLNDGKIAVYAGQISLGIANTHTLYGSGRSSISFEEFPDEVFARAFDDGLQSLDDLCLIERCHSCILLQAVPLQFSLVGRIAP